MRFRSVAIVVGCGTFPLAIEERVDELGERDVAPGYSTPWSSGSTTSR
jgi:hypothetical protein